jgi:hypothetical protein
MLHCKLRTPWLIHFKLCTFIGIYSLTVCILFGEISIFHSRVMGLYSSNCWLFFVYRAVNWEPLRQFTSNFVLLLELIVYWFLKKCVVLLCLNDFFLNIVWMLMTGVSCSLGAAVYLDSSPLKPFGQMNRNLVGSIYGKSSVTIAHFVPIH